MIKQNLTFGEALEALKDGCSISRSGWNGKNMFIYLNKGSVDGLEVEYESENTTTEKDKQLFLIRGVDSDLFDLHGDKGTVIRMPNINMKTAGGEIITGWLASQTDMLSNDWCILKS